MACISAQKTFDSNRFPDEITECNDSRCLKCIEPVYKKYIDPMVSRRMSRIVKRGIYSAKSCMEDAGIETPDAIITGTGLGCIEDTEKFLSSLIKDGEKLLNPTPFIQSTHNTVSSQISLFLKCHAYNITYSHRGLSFESALSDSLMMLNEKTAEHILLGGTDEITANVFDITNRLGHWKKENCSNLNIRESRTKGSVAGEGSVFFLLSGKANTHTYAKIVSVETLSEQLDAESVKKETLSFLEKNNLNPADIDLLLLGINGDSSFGHIYHSLTGTLFSNNACATFKHLCGEYHTASSFATWLAAVILKERSVPAIIRMDNKPIRQLKNILVYNHYRNITHSFILLHNAEF